MGQHWQEQLFLRFNLGPLHLLNGLIDEVLALGTTKSYLRQAVYIGKTVTIEIFFKVSFLFF